MILYELTTHMTHLQVKGIKILSFNSLLKKYYLVLEGSSDLSHPGHYGAGSGEGCVYFQVERILSF